MKRNFQTEFLYQVFALIIAVIIVHAIYVTIVRPRATEILNEQVLQIQEDTDFTVERSFWVLIKDFEQESCFVLMLWAFSIMGYKATRSLAERKLLQQELVPVQDGVRILPEDTREYARTLQELPTDYATCYCRASCFRHWSASAPLATFRMCPRSRIRCVNRRASDWNPNCR